MYLLQDLKVRCQWLHKNSFFITHVVRHKVQISRGEHKVIGKCSVTVDNTQRGALRAMSRHATLAIRAVKTMASRIYFANDTLANQVGERSCSGAFVDGFDDTNKFMAQNAPKTHIAPHNLQV